MNRNRLVLQAITFLITIVTTLISLVIIDARFDEKKANPKERIDYPITSDSNGQRVVSETGSIEQENDEMRDINLRVDDDWVGDEDYEK